MSPSPLRISSREPLSLEADRSSTLWEQAVAVIESWSGPASAPTGPELAAAVGCSQSYARKVNPSNPTQRSDRASSSALTGDPHTGAGLLAVEQGAREHSRQRGEFVGALQQGYLPRTTQFKPRRWHSLTRKGCA
jgi:hypothetical protein